MKLGLTSKNIDCCLRAKKVQPCLAAITAYFLQTIRAHTICTSHYTHNLYDEMRCARVNHERASNFPTNYLSRNIIFCSAQFQQETGA